MEHVTHTSPSTGGLQEVGPCWSSVRDHFGRPIWTCRRSEGCSSRESLWPCSRHAGRSSHRCYHRRYCAARRGFIRYKRWRRSYCLSHRFVGQLAVIRRPGRMAVRTSCYRRLCGRHGDSLGGDTIWRVQSAKHSFVWTKKAEECLKRPIVGQLQAPATTDGRIAFNSPSGPARSSPRARAAFTNSRTAARSDAPGLTVLIASFGIELMLECVSVISDQPSSPTLSARQARNTVWRTLQRHPQGTPKSPDTSARFRTESHPSRGQRPM